MTAHLFYAPHTDDEVIGMAGSILTARDRGEHVTLVLVTDNLPSAHGRDAFAWYGGDLAQARRTEWREACRRLGVTDVRYLGITETSMFTDRTYTQQRLLLEMVALHVECGRDAVHHTTLGESDPHAETGSSNRAHAICEDAARQLHAKHGAPVVLHKVYVYSQPDAFRAAQCVTVIDGVTMARKRVALDAYKADGDRIGYGYRSVPELFDGAAQDAREFFEVVK